MREISGACFLRELEKTLLGTEKNSLWAFKIKLKREGKMRVFPGKLDLDILSAGGVADTIPDLADQFWMKLGSKQS